MTSLLRFTLIFIAAVCSLPASAAPWYRVEMMLVAYENEADIDHELWPDVLPATVSDESMTAYPDYRWWLAPDMMQQMHSALWAGFGFAKAPLANLQAPFIPLTDLRMNEDAERINKRKDMKVVWHQAWIEPISEGETGISHRVNVRVQDKLDIQITGSFELHRSRYLHIGTDLIVQHYVLGDDATLQSLTLPESDARADLRPDLLQQANMEASMAEPALTPIRAAEVKQSRRMRSGELHYLDHPMLGVVIKVIPVEDSSSL